MIHKAMGYSPRKSGCGIHASHKSQLQAIMTTPIEDRLIFHITHIDNLPAIIADGCLWSDYHVSTRPRQRTVIGYETIKRRRLHEYRVSCHPSTFVGQYVPFYFCPRSVMLYVIHRRNADLAYHGGQDRIVHLVARIGAAIQSCPGRQWAFTDGNAGSPFARFCNDLAQFDQYVDQSAVGAKYWSDPTVKERKQAEFLMYESFPWTSVVGIAAIRQDIATEVQQILRNADHQPQVVSKPEWYY